MEKRVINFKGETFIRNVEMIGDTEKITWFNHNKNEQKEIFDEDNLNELEDFYVSIIINNITPKPIL